MQIRLINLTILIFTVTPHIFFSQVNVKDSAQTAYLICPSAGFHMPLYDLKSRFGQFASVGIGFSRKGKNGLSFGINGDFLFNEDVKEKDMLKGITTKDGFLIGGDGTLYDVYYYMRGLQLHTSFSYTIPHSGNNRNSGVFVSLNPGFLLHHIHFEPEDRNAPLQQLTKSGMKNYDRLSGGLSLGSALGYAYLGNRRLVNFFIQVEYVLASAVSQRDYQYDRPGPWRENRKDGYAGIRFGWILPIYKKRADEYFSY